MAPAAGMQQHFQHREEAGGAGTDSGTRAGGTRHKSRGHKAQEQRAQEQAKGQGQEQGAAQADLGRRVAYQGLPSATGCVQQNLSYQYCY